MEAYSDYLKHHGILGMKWGQKNGPPYPLDASQKSFSEKKSRRQLRKEKKALLKKEERAESLRKFVSGEQVTRKEKNQANSEMFFVEEGYVEQFLKTDEAKSLAERWTKAQRSFEETDYDYESKEYKELCDAEEKYLVAEGKYAAQKMLEHFGKYAVIRYETELPYATRNGFMSEKDSIDKIIKKYADDYYHTHRE